MFDYHRRDADYLFHKIDNLIATARSNKVSVLMGIQEKAQLVQQYGKTGADVIFLLSASHQRFRSKQGYAGLAAELFRQG